MSEKGGRPRKYDEEVLKQILYKFIAEESPVKITYKMLAEHTGYPIQAWRFNENLKNEIKQINERIERISFLSNTNEIIDLVNIPSAEELVEVNYNNREKLIKVVDELINVYQYALSKSIDYSKLEKENYELKKKVDSLTSDVEFFRLKNRELTIESIPGLGNANENVRRNVLDLKDKSRMKKRHADLFEK